MRRPALWMLLAQAGDPATPWAAATLGWVSEEAGALFEAYLESPREGSLFAKTGSTVLGGDHFGRFNLLCARFDVTVFELGQPEVFASSVAALGLRVGGRSTTSVGLCTAALDLASGAPFDAVVVGPGGSGAAEDSYAAYLYPEVRYRRALGIPVGELDAVDMTSVGGAHWHHACLTASERERVLAVRPDATTIEEVGPGEDHTAVTMRIAQRWKGRARGVGFGDPLAVLAQLPRLMREDRVAVFGRSAPLAPADVRFSAYTEQHSVIAEEAAALALEVGNPVLVGRQTGDGDLFAWSRLGVAMQITEPNRPAFPVLAAAPHRWTPAPAPDADEPSDDQLRRWAHEGLILTTLVLHSGEIAHNEAMLNLLEIAGATGVRMGMGVHAERYLTAPQQWELLAVAVERGGMRGLIEPILHSGGRGVLAEADCPPEALTEHCIAALEQIREIAGNAQTPTGYYAFCDTDLATLAPSRNAIYAAIERAGLRYIVSSARPGRNRVLRSTDRSVVVNQSCRSVAHASPFIRVTTVEEIAEDASPLRPGWVIATLDAPVIAFNPYVWRHGARFMAIVDWVCAAGEQGERRNVLPSTVARYARILLAEGFLPAPEVLP